MKINEIAGTGNHYAAEYWEYDPRIGRRWNIDPVDQISISNYACFKNNPIMFKHPDGRNSVNSYDNNSKTITVTAKVYFQGKDLPKNTPEKPNAQQDYIDGINQQIKQDFKDQEVTFNGENYTVKYAVVAILDAQNTKNSQNLNADENIMTVDNSLIRAHVGGKDQRGNSIGLNQGYVNRWNDMTANNHTITTHEIGHMLGFIDRYTDYQNTSTKEFRSLAHKGYKEDKMGSSSYPLLKLHSEHIVRLTIFRVVQQQQRLSASLRENSYKVNSLWDNVYDKTETPTEDIPEGWTPKR